MNFRFIKEDFVYFVSSDKAEQTLEITHTNSFQNFFEEITNLDSDQDSLNRIISLQSNEFVIIMYYILISPSFRRFTYCIGWATNIIKALTHRLIEDEKKMECYQK